MKTYWYLVAVLVWIKVTPTEAVCSYDGLRTMTLQVSGDAVQLSGGSGHLRSTERIVLTEAEPNQHGVATATIDATVEEKEGLLVRVRFGYFCGGGTGADGLGVTFGKKEESQSYWGPREYLQFRFCEFCDPSGVQLWWRDRLFDGPHGSKEAFCDEQWHEIELAVDMDSTGGSVFLTIDDTPMNSIHIDDLDPSEFTDVVFSAWTGEKTNFHAIENVEMSACATPEIEVPYSTPTPTSYTHPRVSDVDSNSAVLHGDALLLGGGLIELTKARPGQIGKAFFQKVTADLRPEIVSVRFSYYCGDGTGADGTGVSLHSGIEDESLWTQWGASRGVQVRLGEWGQRSGVAVVWNGGMLLDYTGDSTLYCDATWHDVEILVTVLAHREGASLEVIVDDDYATPIAAVYVPDLDGQQFKDLDLLFSAWTGAETNAHRIRDVKTRVVHASDVSDPGTTGGGGDDSGDDETQFVQAPEASSIECPTQHSSIQVQAADFVSSARIPQCAEAEIAVDEPPSTYACDQEDTCLPFWETIGRGFDLVSGDLKARIYELTRFDGPGFSLDGVEFAVPTEVAVASFENTDAETVSTFAANVPAYVSQRAEALTEGLQATAEWPVFGLKRHAKSVESKFDAGNFVFDIERRIEIGRYSIGDAAQCAGGLIEALNNIEDEDSALDVIQTYGTHVVVGATLGGSIADFQERPAECGHAFPFQTAETLQVAFDLAADPSSDLADVRSAYDVRGGDARVFRQDGWTAWTDTVSFASNPALLTSHLAPIWTLEPDPTRKAALYYAAQAYITSAAVSDDSLCSAACVLRPAGASDNGDNTTNKSDTTMTIAFFVVVPVLLILVVLLVLLYLRSRRKSRVWLATTANPMPLTFAEIDLANREAKLHKTLEERKNNGGDAIPDEDAMSDEYEVSDLSHVANLSPKSL